MFELQQGSETSKVRQAGENATNLVYLGKHTLSRQGRREARSSMALVLRAEALVSDPVHPSRIAADLVQAMCGTIHGRWFIVVEVGSTCCSTSTDLGGLACSILEAQPSGFIRCWLLHGPTTC